MSYPNIEDFDADLDGLCADVLGDTISFKPSAVGSYRAIKAHVDYRDGEVLIGNSEAIAQDITVEVPKLRLTTRPTGTARIRLPKLPGRTFKPIRVRNSASGTSWAFELSEVAE